MGHKIGFYWVIRSKGDPWNIVQWNGRSWNAFSYSLDTPTKEVYKIGRFIPWPK